MDKIVNIIGGLGNQMFQYAFAVALKEAFPHSTVYIDTHHYKNPIVHTFMGNNFYHNGFEINKIFPYANLSIAPYAKIRKVSYYMPNYIVSRIIRRLLPKRNSEFIQKNKDAYIFKSQAFNDRYAYYEGYWMSPKYFDFCKDAILNVFQMQPFTSEKNIALEKEISKESSITIHVRRGDYTKSDIFSGICTLDYYRKAVTLAMSQINNPEFYIFSNDQEWCMENLKDLFGDRPVCFVNNNKGSESYRDMQLMSKARCNILANSSFSWWGAYLNQRKDQIVIVPNKWTNNLDDKDSCPNNWMRI